ncbi:MAG: hypothetical protein DMF15_01900 [Verrucomicrobia bacterium]|nr:MAG: hypothetical protein DMF15_01900 [Verrucomicrobiota bacterium]
MSEREHGPGCGKDDQDEKKKLGGVTRTIALGKAFAKKSKSPQARRHFRIKQPTISTIAA